MMKNQSLVQLRDSIATRLLKSVFSFYVLIAIAVTLAHMVSEYYNQKQDVSQSLVNLQKSFEEGFSVALWHYNEESLTSNLAGMLKVPIIEGLKLRDAEGKTICVGGIIKNKNKYTKKVQFEVNLGGIKQDLSRPPEKGDQPGILKSRLFGHKFPIIYMYKGDKRKLGEATIYSSSDIIFERVELGFIMLIINAGIKTLALWLIFLWFSRKYLSQPLAIFTKATNNLSLDDLDRGHDLKIDIRTKGRNELKVLEETFNSMLGKLQNALKKRKEVEGELRESEEKYRTLFESAPAGIAITTLGGQLLSFNKAFMFLFHYADKQALSRLQLTELLEDPEDFAQLLSELKKEKSLQNYEQNCVDVRGHVFPASLSACFLQYEGHQCLQIILRDISQVKQMESELRNYAHNLQDMVEKKTQELQKANKDLTQALIELEESQEKLSQSAHQAGMAEVAVSVLHNIGNMVTPLNVRTESLKDNAWPQNIRSLQKLRDLFSTGELIFKNKENSQEDSEKLLEYLSTMILMLEKNRDNFYADLQFIKSGLDHISEVIALQQKYAGVSGYETKVDVNALIEDSVEMLRDSIKKREIEVDYDFAELPETTLDRNKMMQIVINLLKNAYEGINEQPGEKKEISIRTELIDKQEEQFIQVKIEDTGVGIDPEHLEEIFNFNYSTKGRGSGFGLHDAANYIQAKYGKIFVHSQGRGQGACVVLQLPLNLINEDRQLENG